MEKDELEKIGKTIGPVSIIFSSRTYRQLGISLEPNLKAIEIQISPGLTNHGDGVYEFVAFTSNPDFFATRTLYTSATITHLSTQSDFVKIIFSFGDEILVAYVGSSTFFYLESLFEGGVYRVHQKFFETRKRKFFTL